MEFLNEGAVRATFQEISTRGADPDAIEADVKKAMRTDGIYVIPTYLRDPRSGDSRRHDRRRVRQMGHDHDENAASGVRLSRILVAPFA
jgi:hypothetical protein